MDDDLSYYSFIPVLGSDGSIVAVPYLGMSDSSEGVGALNDSLLSSSSPVEDSEIDLQADKSNVQVVQDLADLESQRALAASTPLLSSSDDLPEIGTSSPSPLLFNGAVWVSGVDDVLGDITVYFPVESKHAWGLDSSGRLVYVGNTSMNGYLAGVYNNALTVSSFSRPRYRLSNSYDYTYLSMIPHDSNAPIAVSDAPRVVLSDALPLFFACALGVIILFLSRLHR